MLGPRGSSRDSTRRLHRSLLLRVTFGGGRAVYPKHSLRSPVWSSLRSWLTRAQELQAQGLSEHGAFVMAHLLQEPHGFFRASPEHRARQVSLARQAAARSTCARVPPDTRAPSRVCPHRRLPPACGSLASGASPGFPRAIRSSGRLASRRERRVGDGEGTRGESGDRIDIRPPRLGAERAGTKGFAVPCPTTLQVCVPGGPRLSISLPSQAVLVEGLAPAA